MLYVSTRDKTNSFTAYRALHESRAPGGGLFMPFHMAEFTEAEITQFLSKSFSENASKILNYFFSSSLDSWSMECVIGKKPVSVISAGQKVYIAELWHNPQKTYAYLEKSLVGCLDGNSLNDSSWVRIAIKVASLFGIYAECSSLGIHTPDLAVDADDFSSVISALTARKMGLPIENIVCCFQKNSEAWNFIHHGELNTFVCPPDNMERFVYFTLGLQETKRYLSVAAHKGNYKITEEQYVQMSNNLFPTVVGQGRTESLADLANRSNLGKIDDVSAMTFGGLQDYRAKTGESRNTLLLSYNAPKE